MSIRERLMHAWNAFTNKDPTFTGHNLGMSYSYRPDRVRLRVTNERSIVSAIYNRIGIDVAAISFKHVKVDENDRLSEEVKDGLNECLTVESNIDQTGRAFIQDIVMSMLDEGCVAIVPIDTTINPKVSNSYDIQTMRTGKILEWFPNDVRLKVYNEKTGQKEEITLPKKMVAIVENPLYAVMNEPNSTLQRLIHKLNLLDAIDEQSSSGKLDILVQLPYTIRSEARANQAEKRRKDIEKQLAGSKYGIAYIDGTERVTQLNRPAENNLMQQIEYLTRMLYSQLGITDTVLDGTADEKVMLNYYNRTIEPIASAIADSMKRTFLTKTARTQGHTIMFFKDAFKLVPVNQIADIADKFTRNEILSSNEVRGIIGFEPVDDERADQLINKNINQGMAPGMPMDEGMAPGMPMDEEMPPEGEEPMSEDPVENGKNIVEQLLQSW